MKKVTIELDLEMELFRIVSFKDDIEIFRSISYEIKEMFSGWYQYLTPEQRKIVDRIISEKKRG